MKIDLGKFGEILVSRPAGREAYLAMQAYQIKDIPATEPIEVDFTGVKVLAPSWADEVLTPLVQKYPQTTFLHTENSSVQATLKTLEQYPTPTAQ